MAKRLTLAEKLAASEARNAELEAELGRAPAPAVPRPVDDVVEAVSWFKTNYPVLFVALVVFGASVFGASIVDAPDKGSALNLLDRTLDAVVGGSAGIIFMAALLLWFQPLVFPNLDEARLIVAKVRTGEPISQGEAVLAAGILIGAAVRIFALIFIMTAFGLLI